MNKRQRKKASKRLATSASAQGTGGPWVYTLRLSPPHVSDEDRKRFREFLGLPEEPSGRTAPRRK